MLRLGLASWYANARSRFSERLFLRAMYKSWTTLTARGIQSKTNKNMDRLLIVPCDPWSVVGSRGDEAMIVAVVQHFTEINANVEIAVITADTVGSRAVWRRGLQPLEAWHGAQLLRNLADSIEKFDPDMAVVLGADVMDGYYSPINSLTLLATADLLIRRGTRTSLLGFSFNEHPSHILRSGFDMLCPQLKINVRDPVSLRRFQAFSKAPARLVADTAFMLRPAESFPRYHEIATWVENRKQQGDVVLAINVHPMLIKHTKEDQVSRLISQISEALEILGGSRAVSFLLLPHDYRENIGDNLCLGPIAQRLSLKLPDRLLHVAEEHSAAELKLIVGLADGLISSRMHLAIASLGMGKPVAVFTYQDKFQGLLRHFNLPGWLLMEPPGNSADKLLNSVMQRFVDELPILRSLLTKRLPSVIDLAKLNFELY